MGSEHVPRHPAAQMGVVQVFPVHPSAQIAHVGPVVFLLHWHTFGAEHSPFTQAGLQTAVILFLIVTKLENKKLNNKRIVQLEPCQPLQQLREHVAYLYPTCEHALTCLTS